MLVQFPYCNYDAAWVAEHSTFWHGNLSQSTARAESGHCVSQSMCVDLDDSGWRLVTQIYNRVQVHYMPVERALPGDEHDEWAFANRVRDAMAKFPMSSSPLAQSDHTFDDVKLLYSLQKASVGYGTKHVTSKITVHEVELWLNLSLSDFTRQIDLYCEADTDQDGALSFHEFEQMFPFGSTHSKAMFGLLDKDGSGFIDFADSLLAFALLNPNISPKQVAKLALRLVCASRDGITRTEYEQIIQFGGRVLGSALDKQSLMAQFDNLGKEAWLDKEDLKTSIVQRHQFDSLARMGLNALFSSLMSSMRIDFRQASVFKTPRVDHKGGDIEPHTEASIDDNAGELEPILSKVS